MDSIAIFVVGVAGMLLSGWLIWHFWETERPSALVLSAQSSVGSRLQAVAQRSAGMISAAVVAGLLVPGMGGRLMMRLLAATSPESAQGRLTDAEEVVGEITFGGTFFLVVFIGMFGGLMSLGIFVLLRRWLPKRSIMAGLVVAGIGGGLFARPTGFIDPDNRDFSILSPVWLAVACALLVVVVFGVLFAVLTDAWATRWHPIDGSLPGVVAAVPVGLILLVASLAVLPALFILVAVAFGVFVKPRLNEIAITKTESVGRKITGVMGLIGGAWMLTTVVQVLRV